MENPFRSFLSHFHQTKTEALWATAKHNKDIFQDNQASINHFGAALEHNKGYRCISWRSNSIWSFGIKLTNHILPTIDILQTRYSSIYKDWKCPLCLIEQETLFHLFTCKSLAIQWSKARNKCIEEYIRYFVDKTERKAKEIERNWEDKRAKVN